MIKTLQIEVLKRFMDEKDLKSFMQSYNESLYHSREVQKPNEKDVRIDNLFRKERSISKVAKLVGLSTGGVYGALARVSAYRK